MGPQLYRCGNSTLTRYSSGRIVLLQWGRNFIVAEMAPSSTALHHSAYQLQWGRNFIVAEITKDARHRISSYHASMGPQLYRCGNVHFAHTLYLIITLLQWGRNFIVAEIRSAAKDRLTDRLASMGPQLYRCGNAKLSKKLKAKSNASMGPQLYRCGNDCAVGDMLCSRG